MRTKQVPVEPPVESGDSSTSSDSSGSDSSSADEREPVKPVAAPKKVCKPPLSDARLAQLQAAREKAVEARRRVGDVKRAEKALKEQELQARIDRVQAIEAALKKKTAPKKQHPRRSKAPPPPSSSSDSNCSSESSSSEEEEEPRRAPARKHSRRQTSAPPQPTAHQHLHAMAYGSLFPGAGNNPYV